MAEDPFWPLAKILLRLQHLGPLQMADFGRDPLDRGGDHAERGKEHRVAIARDDLGRHRFGHQAEPVADMRLDRRVDIGERADRARDRAGGDFGAGGLQPGAVAVHLGIHARKFQPKGGGFGMDAMAAADGDGVPVFHGAGLQRGEQPVDIGQQQVGRPGQLDIEGGVEHIRTGHPLMDETGLLGADDLAQMGQEGDHVMLVSRSMASIRATSNSASFARQTASALALGITPIARPGHRRHGPRSRTRCGTSSRATRSRPFRGGNSGGSWWASICRTRGH
jgi:hypothetical protein